MVRMMKSPTKNRHRAHRHAGGNRHAIPATLRPAGLHPRHPPGSVARLLRSNGQAPRLLAVRLRLRPHRLRLPVSNALPVQPHRHRLRRRQPRHAQGSKPPHRQHLPGREEHPLPLPPKDRHGNADSNLTGREAKSASRSPLT